MQGLGAHQIQPTEAPKGATSRGATPVSTPGGPGLLAPNSWSPRLFPLPPHHFFGVQDNLPPLQPSPNASLPLCLSASAPHSRTAGKGLEAEPPSLSSPGSRKGQPGQLPDWPAPSSTSFLLAPSPDASLNREEPGAGQRGARAQTPPQPTASPPLTCSRILSC